MKFKKFSASFSPPKVLPDYVYFKKNFFLKYHSAQPLLYSTDPHAGSGASVIIKIEYGVFLSFGT